MYSPYSDLQKMWNSPNYLVFRFSVDGKEYFGRPIDVLCKKENADSPTTLVGYRYIIYNNLIDFRNGLEKERVEIYKSQFIVGKEVVDSISLQNPSPINLLLESCNRLDSFKNVIEIGLLKRIIPDILNEIYSYTKDFLSEHPRGNERDLRHFIDKYIKEIETIPYSASKLEIDNLFRDIIEVISSEISIIIRHAEGNEAIQFPEAEILCRSRS